jgi:catechol 2,3-dioxygenase-like lactoylglutathione lyase family enzyme
MNLHFPSRIRHRVAFLFIVAVLMALARHAAVAQNASPFESSRVTHIGVIVKDPATVAKVYSQVFGLPIKEPANMPGKIEYPKSYSGDRNAIPRYTFASLSDVGIEILTPVGGASPWREYLDKYGDGLHHICIAVKDIPAAVAHLVALGGKQELGGMPGVGYAYVNFRDQLGFTIELSQLPATPPAPSTPPAQDATAILNARISHVGIFVPNVEKTAAVMGQILGMAVPQARTYPGIMFPEGFTGDPQAHPKIITFPMNIGIEFAENQGGVSPWSDYVKKYGPAMHHLGISAKTDTAQTVSALEKMGGTVIMRAPGGTTTFIDLKPQPMALAIELGGPPKK